MIRKLFTFVFALFMLCSLYSCTTYTYATTQDDIYVETQADVVQSNVDFNLVIRYGTPYYYEGELLYYLYNDLYYYPFYYDNYWYVRVYRRPFAYIYHRPYFRPNRYDYRFEPGRHHGFDRPRPNPNPGHNRNVTPQRPRNDRNGRFGNGRPDNRRPDNRNVTPQQRPNQNNQQPNRTVTPQQRPNQNVRTVPQGGNIPRMGNSTPQRQAPVRSNGGGGGRFGGRR